MITIPSPPFLAVYLYLKRTDWEERSFVLSARFCSFMVFSMVSTYASLKIKVLLRVLPSV